MNLKPFLTYTQQIEKLKSKHLIIDDEDVANLILKKTSYYSLISGYKEIFKEDNGLYYKSNAKFNDIYQLYRFDESLRSIFLKYILIVERSIKSLYSYAFCSTIGDKQCDYMNKNNYNYKLYKDDIDDFFEILTKKTNPKNKKNGEHKYLYHYLNKYQEVPLWVLVNTMTFGNISKMYEFSLNKVQSKISVEFKYVYSNHLVSMLNVISKFRNVCAHNERLYNYRTKNSIPDFPIHKILKIPKNGAQYKYGKNDLFSIFICLKYLLHESDFINMVANITILMRTFENTISSDYFWAILDKMGFPKNWSEIIELNEK